MTFEEWLNYGRYRGFCSAAVCATHDGVPSTEAEDAEWENDGEPCVLIIRPYMDGDEKAAVEANFPPAVWRS